MSRYKWDPKFTRNQTARNNAEQAAGWRHGRQDASALFGMSPSRSYTDMVMYRTRHMLETFADGIYYVRGLCQSAAAGLLD